MRRALCFGASRASRTRPRAPTASAPPHGRPTPRGSPAGKRTVWPRSVCSPAPSSPTRRSSRRAARDTATRRRRECRARRDSTSSTGTCRRPSPGSAGGPPGGERCRYAPPPRVPSKAGLNKFNWNLRAPEPVAFEGMIMWAAGVIGPVVPPGTYSVRLTAADKTESQSFSVLKDPRSGATQADLDAQSEFLLKVRDKTSEANNAVRTIRNVKAQLAERRKRAAGKGAALDRLAPALRPRLSEVEGEIYQVRNRSGQDPLNYPIKLNNQIAALMFSAGSAEARPTSQSYEVFRLLSDQLDVQLGKPRQLLGGGLAGVNAELGRIGPDQGVPGAAGGHAPRRGVRQVGRGLFRWPFSWRLRAAGRRRRRLPSRSRFPRIRWSGRGPTCRRRGGWGGGGGRGG